MLCRCGHGDLAHTSTRRCVLCDCVRFVDPQAPKPVSVQGRRAWLVRADPEIRPYIWPRGVIGVSWDIQIEVPAVMDEQEMFEFFRSQRNISHEPDGRLRVTSREMFAFIYDIGVGDYILTPMDSKILIGQILGAYDFRPGLLPSRSNPVGHAHTRAVRWLQEVARHDFSNSAQQTLKFRQTIREASSYLREILELTG